MISRIALHRQTLCRPSQMRALWSLPVRSIVRPPKVDKNFDKSDDLSDRPVIELDKFYAQMLEVNLSDERCLEFMKFAAKVSHVNFKDQAEMMSFKSDFEMAIKFITLLDHIDVKGQEPLGNVLEVYGGNGTKMRTE